MNETTKNNIIKYSLYILLSFIILSIFIIFNLMFETKNLKEQIKIKDIILSNYYNRDKDEKNNIYQTYSNMIKEVRVNENDITTELSQEVKDKIYKIKENLNNNKDFFDFFFDKVKLKPYYFNIENDKFVISITYDLEEDEFICFINKISKNENNFNDLINIISFIEKGNKTEILKTSYINKTNVKDNNNTLSLFLNKFNIHLENIISEEKEKRRLVLQNFQNIK